MPFYAVAKGRTAGIFMTWADCEAQVKGFPGARYKKFDTVVSAQDFISAEGGKPAPTKKYKPLGNTSSSQNVSMSSNKRSFATSNGNQSKQKKRTSKTHQESDSDSQFSDGSDDLNAIISKQMDDIESRIQGFEKGVDKIIKKSAKGTSHRKTMLIEPPQPKKLKVGNEFDIDDEGFIQVYTDGACSANGRSGARAGLGVYWADSHPLNISKPVSGRATNNCGEIQAATMAIKQAIDNGVNKLAINTDSQFLINSVTKWMPGWKRKGWKIASGEPVKNETDFKELDSLQHKLQIKWNYVEAHKGVHGNEMADQLAKAGATMYKK